MPIGCAPSKTRRICRITIECTRGGMRPYRKRFRRKVNMYRNLNILLFLMCTVSTAAVFAQTTPNTPVLEPPKAETHYIIAPNDVLNIFVYKEPNLSGKVTV